MIGSSLSLCYPLRLELPTCSFLAPFARSALDKTYPTGGTAVLVDGVRVFRQFAWLEAGSVKVALSHPTHQRVTRVVGR
jgi:hypothetical protein